MPAPMVTDVGGPIPAEWDLRCTRCGYNLTGLVGRVCPECGQRFKPRATWLANREPTQRSVFLRFARKLAVGAFLAVLLGAGIGFFLRLGGLSEAWLIVLIWPLISVWAILELVAFSLGRDVSNLRILFVVLLMATGIALCV